MKRPDTCNVPLIMAWCGRIKIYSGADVIGQKLLKEALQRDPDCTDAMRAIKAGRTAAQSKEEAGALFKAAKYDEAIQKFDECLQLDPLNLGFNATIQLNKSIALTKKGKHDEAMSALNKSLKMNPAYAKALVKRGEVHQQLGDWEEAVSDFGAAQQIDPTSHGVQQKLKIAQQNAKKNKRKDYYEILGVSKDASE